METTKQKVISINTQGAQKNVKTLKQQIKELKQEMAQLEKGTEQYNTAAKQLADLNQKQIEINEAMKYSNQDLGQTLGNLTNVAAGVVGAINGINAVMTMMGADSEEAQEALKNIQLTMALIQGLGAMDTARKALEGLKNAFGNIGTTEQLKNTETLTADEIKLTSSVAGTTAAETKETSALNTNTTAKNTNAKATQKAAVAEGTLNKTVKASEPILKGAVTGIKNMAIALKNLVVANPALLAIVAAITAVAIAFSNYNKKLKERNEETQKWLELESEALTKYQQSKTHIETLTDALKDNNSSYAEKKKAIEELNKVIPNFKGKVDETTKSITYSKDALKAYNDKLYQKNQLETYENNYNKLLEKQQELIVKINIAQENGLKKRKLKELIKDLSNVNKELDKTRQLINGVDLSKALDENKPKTITKTFKEIVAEIKAIYKDLIDTIYNEKQFTRTYNGVYNKSVQLMDNIERAVKQHGFDKELTEQFKKGLENGFADIDLTKFNVTYDFVFNEKSIDNLRKQLDEAEGELSKKIKTGASEKDIKNQQQTISRLKEELNGRIAVLDALQAYKDYDDELAKTHQKKIQQQEQYNQQLEIEAEYHNDIRTGNEYADVNKEINNSKLKLDIAKESLQMDEQELAMLKSKKYQNEQTVNRIIELENGLFEKRKAVKDAEKELDEAEYQSRLKYVELYYNDAVTKYEKAAAKLETKRSFWGLGTANYNTEVDALKIEYQAIVDTQNEIEAFYKQQMAQYSKGTAEWMALDLERQQALTEIEKDGAKKRAEIAQAEAERKLAIHQAYVNAYQNITGQIQSLLNAEMSLYDENSKQYKNMRYANGVIDTLSGTLSAFMSGIESGLPAPANAILGAIMAGLTFQTGVAQLKAIESETLTNSTNANIPNFGTYDTLTYQQNSEILSSIQDQRVYVLENDISSTQRRVQVVENSSAF